MRDTSVNPCPGSPQLEDLVSYPERQGHHECYRLNPQSYIYEPDRKEENVTVVTERGTTDTVASWVRRTGQGGTVL